MYDVSGDYVVSYVSAGICIAFSGAILYLIPFLTKDRTSTKGVKESLTPDTCI